MGIGILLLGTFVAAAALGAACEDDSPGGPAATPTAREMSPTSTPTPSPSPTPTEETKTPPPLADELPLAPAPGPCPVQAEICDAAIDVFQWAKAGDMDALMDSATPRIYTCPAAGFDTSAICDQVALGTAVEGFVFAVAAHGPTLPADEFRAAIEPHVAFLSTAEAESVDRYAFGELRIAAIGCFRHPDTPVGECANEYIQVSLTYVSHADGPGPPGRRMICFDLHWREDGARPGLSGFGCGIPPLHNLETWEIPASVEEGVDGTLANYPWTPPAELLATYPWSTRTGVPVVDSVLATLVSGAAMPIQPTRLRCVAVQDGIGGPPLCPEGASEGTEVDAFLSAQCHGAWVAFQSRRPRAANSGEPSRFERLFAIGRPEPPRLAVEDGGVPSADYVVVIATVAQLGESWEAVATALYVGTSGVTWISHSCGHMLDSYATDAALVANGWLLPPRFPGEPTSMKGPRTAGAFLYGNHLRRIIVVSEHGSSHEGRVAAVGGCRRWHAGPRGLRR